MVAFTRALVLDGAIHIMDMVTAILIMGMVMVMAIPIMEVTGRDIIMVTMMVTGDTLITATTHMTIIIMDIMKMGITIHMDPEIPGMDTTIQMKLPAPEVTETAEL